VIEEYQTRPIKKEITEEVATLVYERGWCGGARQSISFKKFIWRERLKIKESVDKHEQFFERMRRRQQRRAELQQLQQQP
jgi:hypothetical protein